MVGQKPVAVSGRASWQGGGGSGPVACL